MPFINFDPGQILTADQLDSVSKQTVMVFDDAAARDTALAGELAQGMVVYLKDINRLQKYDGSAFGPVGEDAILNEGESGQDVVSDGLQGIRYENSISPFLLLGV